MKTRERKLKLRLVLVLTWCDKQLRVRAFLSLSINDILGLSTLQLSWSQTIKNTLQLNESLTFCRETRQNLISFEVLTKKISSARKVRVRVTSSEETTKSMLQPLRPQSESLRLRSPLTRIHVRHTQKTAFSFLTSPKIPQLIAMEQARKGMQFSQWMWVKMPLMIKLWMFILVISATSLELHMLHYRVRCSPWLI